MTRLNERAMLVQLNISMWTARKLDKSETDALNRAHGASSKAARVNKSLLPTSLALDTLQRKAGVIRQEYYGYTLPWAMDGARIIKAEAYMDFTSRMRDHLNDWDGLVSDFRADYPRLRVDAQRALGTLYKREDYPSEREIAGRFRAGVNFLPLPDAADWRVDGIDEEMEDLRKQVTQQVEEGLTVAMRDAWERVRDVVAKAHDRLRQPDAIFRDTLVTNAIELCRVLPVLNLTDDPHLEQIRRELEQSLCSCHPDDLRQSKKLRSDTAHKMDDIMRKMGAFYQAAA